MIVKPVAHEPMQNGYHNKYAFGWIVGTKL